MAIEAQSEAGAKTNESLKQEVVTALKKLAQLAFIPTGIALLTLGFGTLVDTQNVYKPEEWAGNIPSLFEFFKGLGFSNLVIGILGVVFAASGPSMSILAYEGLTHKNEATSETNQPPTE
jgi:hypothetical protein